MIDHVGIAVSDYAKSLAFYQYILAPLDYVLDLEEQGFAGFKPVYLEGPIANFWIHQEDSPISPMHIAFAAPDRNTVDLFYETAMGIGARDNGKPGIRAMYHANYYGAFILDPDGHNIEAVCHQPE